ncbi:glycoside hydrolase family 55 protein [Capillimicrobium parvum]|uniref:Pectate lyase superfamily protein domain-containing protein n=1 Tax=Capillimicrobium parvum TaxID=2884022 RepID=A0A9E6XYW1_9ACTN|nr:glycoside hydrolase family 55 protein [Capillimicrobium parvum]UGS36850.1 hypothetical protein DSM104329_03261 [Capillimicrobium parvum]
MIRDEHHPPCGSDDDAPAIQAALDAAHGNGGGTVVIPPGRWLVGGPLRVPDNVTLRGVTITASILRRTGGDGPMVEVSAPAGDAPAEGWAVECLTLDGAGSGATCGIEVCGAARYGIIRRVWIRNVAHDGLRCSGGTLEHLCVEGLTLERCGRTGASLLSDDGSAGVFLSEVSVRDFGLRRGTGPAYAGVRLGMRCIISQLHIEPVPPGRVGLLFGAGSDHASVSGLYVGTRGGAPCIVADGVAGVSMSTPAVRYLEPA